MAITKILARRARLDILLNYALNGRKTDDQILIHAIACSTQTAYGSMEQVKKHFDKPDGVQGYHIIQSFKAGEITPALALQIAKEFCSEHLGGYQVVIGTHVDKAHVHNHIVFNSVSYKDGKKYHSNPGSYYKQIRAISDRLCTKHGLSVVIEKEESRKGLTYPEWKSVQRGHMTQHQILEQDVQEVLSYALDYGQFLSFMEDKGYKIHHGKYLSFLPIGGARSLRPKLQGIRATEQGIRDYLDGVLQNPDSPVILPKTFRAFAPYPKAYGIVALYLHYLYVLNAIGKGHNPPRQYRALKLSDWRGRLIFCGKTALQLLVSLWNIRQAVKMTLPGWKRQGQYSIQKRSAANQYMTPLPPSPALRQWPRCTNRAQRLLIKNIWPTSKLWSCWRVRMWRSSLRTRLYSTARSPTHTSRYGIRKRKSLCAMPLLKSYRVCSCLCLKKKIKPFILIHKCIWRKNDL